MRHHTGIRAAHRSSILRAPAAPLQRRCCRTRSARLCRRYTPYTLRTSSGCSPCRTAPYARRRNPRILLKLPLHSPFLTGLFSFLYKTHGCHHRRVQHAADRPDKPAVLRLHVAHRAEGVEQEYCRHGEPVYERHRAAYAPFRFLAARIVALFKELVQRVLICPDENEHARGYTHKKQQHAHRRDAHYIRCAHAAGGDDRHGGEDAQHRRNDIHAGICMEIQMSIFMTELRHWLKITGIV